MRSSLALVGAALAVASLVAATATASPLGGSASGPPTIRVHGRNLVDGADRPVQLRGVNRAAFESRCRTTPTASRTGPSARRLSAR